MSGLFGFWDPLGELPNGTAERMGRAMCVPADRSMTILDGPGFALGCATKAIYPGEGEALVSRDGQRHGLFVGRLLGFCGENQPADPRATAREAFLDDPSPDRLAAANGPFAAAVWDERHHQLELITDRYGMYPIYLAAAGSARLFAGQIKGLLGSGVISREFDALAVALMVSIGELVGDLTPLHAVRIMPAAVKATFSLSGVRQSRYWQYSFREEADDFEATAVRLGGRLRTAVARVTSSSASVGVPLSGGLDSRTLLAATPDPARVPSFTWGLAGCRDLRYGAEAARALGSLHQAFIYDGSYLERLAALGVWLTEGQLPCTDFHVLPYVNEVAQHCTVILNGYAGDAILGGNFVKRAWWHAADGEAAASALWSWRDAFLAPAYRDACLGSRSCECNLADAREAFLSGFRQAPGNSPLDRAMAFLLDNRVRRRTSGGTSLIRWRMESDHPFFDGDFFDDVARVPYAWRFRHRLYRCMLRSVFATAASVPWQRTGLPARAPSWMMYLSLGVHKLDRIKRLRPLFRGRKVSDFEGWMRGPLQSYIKEVLDSPRTLDRGLFGADMARRIVQDHRDGAADNSSVIGAMLALELFARLFVDDDTALVAPFKCGQVPLRRVSLKTGLCSADVAGCSA